MINLLLENNAVGVELIEQFHQLFFEIDNRDAPNTIYITSDSALNQLTFTITTNVDDTIFTPGELVEKSKAPEAIGSILYLDLRGLQLTGDEFGKLVCEADGWMYQLFPDENLICLTPTKGITLNSSADEMIAIKISGMTITNPPAGQNANLNVSYYRVKPATIGSAPLSSFFKVLIQNPPAGHADLHANIDCVISGYPYVCNSLDPDNPVNNDLSFVFQPGYSPKVVNAGPDTKFIISFIYADSIPGYGALTTPELASNPMTIQQGLNAEKWVVSFNGDDQNPSWLLAPPTGQAIIGSGVKSIVQFEVKNIQTYFQPGPTLMFIQYIGVPGYNDGYYYILINKIPKVSITYFRGVPNPVSLMGDGNAQVQLEWEVNDAGTLVLLPGLIDVTGKTFYDVIVRGDTEFTLNAQGKYLSSNGNIASYSITEIISDYEGIYLRKNLSQESSKAYGDDVFSSPDIIPYGANVIEPGNLISFDNWEKGLGQPLLVNQYNFIYVRGKNNTNTVQKGILELYYTPSNKSLQPETWISNKIPLGNNPDTFQLEIEAQPYSPWVGNVPFQLKPTPLPDDSEYYCLIARMTNDPFPTGIISEEQLIDWVKEPEVAWRKESMIFEDTPTWQKQYPINIDETTRAELMIEFSADVPIGVQASFISPGPGANPMVYLYPVTKNMQGPMTTGIMTDIVGGFDSIITLSVWDRGKTIPDGASIELIVATIVND